MDNSRAVTFAAVYAVLTASHEVADHWVQIDTQAGAKGQPGRAGVRACSAHVLSLGVARSASSGSTMIAQLGGMRWLAMGARQVSRTEAVAS